MFLGQILCCVSSFCMRVSFNDDTECPKKNSGDSNISFYREWRHFCLHRSAEYRFQSFSYGYWMQLAALVMTMTWLQQLIWSRRRPKRRHCVFYDTPSLNQLLLCNETSGATFRTSPTVKKLRLPTCNKEPRRSLWICCFGFELRRDIVWTSAELPTVHTLKCNN